MNYGITDDYEADYYEDLLRDQEGRKQLGQCDGDVEGEVGEDHEQRNSEGDAYFCAP